jgi:hypothetical protein
VHVVHEVPAGVIHGGKGACASRDGFFEVSERRLGNSGVDGDDGCVEEAKIRRAVCTRPRPLQPKVVEGRGGVRVL